MKVSEMKVSKQCVVELTWSLKDGGNELLDELEAPVAFLVGGDDLLPAIDEALLGKSAGNTIEVQIEPEHAFGNYDELLVFLEPRKCFPTDLEAGEMFEDLPIGCTPDAPKGIIYTVQDVYPEHVVLDGNHPLAGVTLRLTAKIHSVREATIEEIGAGTLGAGFFKILPPQGPGPDDHIH